MREVLSALSLFLAAASAGLAGETGASGAACQLMGPLEAEKAYAASRVRIPKQGDSAPYLVDLDLMSVDSAACRSLHEPDRPRCDSLAATGEGNDSLWRRCVILYEFGALIGVFAGGGAVAAQCRRFAEVAHPGQDNAELCRRLAAAFPRARMADVCAEFFPDDPSHCVHWFADSKRRCDDVGDALSQRECLRNASLVEAMRERDPRRCGSNESFCRATAAGARCGAPAFTAAYCRHRHRLSARGRSEP